MLKLAKLKDPHHDAAAADVLAAFEAAQGGGMPTVECYHAAVGAWRRAHPDHTATYSAQQAVRIVLDVKTSLRIEEVCGGPARSSIKEKNPAVASDAPCSLAPNKSQ